MNALLHHPSLNFAGAIAAGLLMIAQATGAVPWAGLGVNVALVAGVAVANFQLADLRRRVERMEDHAMYSNGANHQRSTSKGAGK